jgi:signal transduction histidine kinase
MTESAGELESLMAEVGALAESYEQGRGQLLTLAGIGLAVEVLAHELTRATDHALATLADLSDGELPAATASLIRTLKNQLKTLQKRLRILDPLSVSGRQTKETFDVVELVRDTLSAHQAQFERERIHPTLTVVPKPTRVMIHAVRGMVVQVLENFIANSVYWLLQQRKLDPSHHAKLTVTIDTVARELAVTDSGPGVPHDLVERVFHPFFTTKPPGQGRGLGLFIAREIARYHGVDVFIADAQSGTGKTHHTFVLTLPGTKA